MLKLEGLQKTYGQRLALQNLNLEVASGEIYGLLGPNGAGKTTTINLICNLLQPDKGHIWLNGAPLSERAKRLIGVVPQETILYRSLTCRENLLFFASLYGLKGAEKQRQITTWLAAVGLAERANSPAEALSGGMQRRLSLAIALIHRPKLVILDEPTNGLDLEARYEIWELIRQLQQQGMTVLMTTHQLDEAERLCQRIGILRQGQLLAEGSLAELRQQIPAQEILLIQTPEEQAAIDRATEQGFTYRRYGSDLAFWLPQSLELKEILSRFEGIPLTAISRQPVRLEHIYLEVTQQPSVSAG